jgi:DMSO/TMAO reductase YedYZ molybdopterin-dependent catalytic subunit
MRLLDAASRGVPAGVAAVVASLGYAGLTREFVAAPVSRAVVRSSPDAVVAFAITTLGSTAQTLVLGGALLAVTALFAATGVLGWLAGEYAGRAWVGVPVGAVLAGGLGQFLTATWEVGVVTGLAVGVVLAAFALRFPQTAGEPRRRVLRGVAGVAVGAGIGSLLARERTYEPDDYVRDPVAVDMLSAASTRDLGVDGLEPLVSREFYEVDINAINPRVRQDDWTLSVAGLGAHGAYSLEALREFPVEHRFVTLRCVGDPRNGYKLDTALWTGVPVDEVLADAGAPESCCVMGRAADGYFVEVPREALRGGLLAFRMNGRPLPRAHGAPVRLLVPGHWGETNVKWLEELELLRTPEDGHWEQRGWHGTGSVNTVAKLHRKHRDGDHVTVAGHAYAGTRGVGAVEVSTDGGDTWSEATLGPRLPGARSADGEQIRAVARDAWRQWHYEFTASDERDVVVRAVEADGTVQPEERTDAKPRGASGWVRRTV